MDINLNYLKEPQGTLNVAEWIASLLVLICAGSSPTPISGGGWVYFVSITAVILSFGFLIMYMTRAVDGLHQRVNVFLIRLAYCVVFAGFYFISMCVSAAGAANTPAASTNYSRVHSSNTAAAVFGAIAVVTFLWDALEAVRRNRAGNTEEITQATDPIAAGHAAEMRYT